MTILMSSPCSSSRPGSINMRRGEKEDGRKSASRRRLALRSAPAKPSAAVSSTNWHRARLSRPSENARSYSHVPEDYGLHNPTIESERMCGGYQGHFSVKIDGAPEREVRG